MPIGSKDKGTAFDVKAGATVVSGDPVVVGGVSGVAWVTATNTAPGNEDTGDYYTTVHVAGEYLFTVAGTLNIGAPVYVATGTPVAGQAVKATLTATAGTGAKKLFGFITGIGQESGTALVSLAGTTNAAGPA